MSAAESGKSFHIRRRRDNGQAETLNLELERTDGGPPLVRAFTFYPKRVPAMVGLDLVGMKVNMNFQPMWDLFQAMMPEDFDEFRDILRSPDYEIEAEELKGIMQWMVEQSGERPTTPSSP